jgi:hypothetical protein
MTAVAPVDGGNPGGAFCHAAAAAFATAWQLHPTEERWLTIARRTVCLRLAGTHIADAIAPAFQHLRGAAQPAADLTIDLWDTAGTGVDPPPLEWQGGAQRDAVDRIGRVRSLCDARLTVVHEPASAQSCGQFWALDRQAAHAVVWMQDVEAVPVWDRIHPLRRLLHTWARGFGADLVHAGAVGISGAGVLVVGPGGTGKSTTVLAAMQGGLISAGDDYVLIDDGAPPTAHGLFGTMRLHQAHLDRFPALMAHRDHVFAEPWSGRTKVTSYVSRHKPDGLTSALRLVGIVVPFVSGDATADLMRETPARAAIALAPSSILQVDPGDAGMLLRLTRLCRGLPCWRLPIGPDLAQVAVRLEALIRGQDTSPALRLPLPHFAGEVEDAQRRG